MCTVLGPLMTFGWFVVLPILGLHIPNILLWPRATLRQCGNELLLRGHQQQQKHNSTRCKSRGLRCFGNLQQQAQTLLSMLRQTTVAEGANAAINIQANSRRCKSPLPALLRQTTTKGAASLLLALLSETTVEGTNHRPTCSTQTNSSSRGIKSPLPVLPRRTTAQGANHCCLLYSGKQQ